MRVLFSNESVRLELRYLSLTRRFSELLRSLCSRYRFSGFPRNGAKPLSGCVYGAASITSLKRSLNNIDHSDAADPFCAGCLIGLDRVAAIRRAAFLRRKYATRRLRLIRTRSCCPMGSLWIENRRNAIGIATDRAFSSYGLSRSKTKTRGTALNLRWQSP
jgi:hypothetical protein